LSSRRPQTLHAGAGGSRRREASFPNLPGI
jgi:hypothetical protein